MLRWIRNLLGISAASASGACTPTNVPAKPATVPASAAATRPTLEPIPSEVLDHEMGDKLVRLFSNHDIRAKLDHGGVTTSDGRFRLGCVTHPTRDSPNTQQFDFFFDALPSLRIAESFVGFGKTHEKRSEIAFQRFAEGTFHVLLAAFFDRRDEQVELETWSISGTRRQALIGGLQLAGTATVEFGTEWFKVLRRAVESQNLSPDMHWIRFYYGGLNNETIACEVLLDNEPWPELQTQMAGFSWPRSPGFYSIRVFLILKEPGAEP